MPAGDFTYGCGKLLPGTGIFNFPDYVPGPGVDNPGPGPGVNPGGGGIGVIDPDPGEELCQGVVCPEGEICNPSTGRCISDGGGPPPQPPGPPPTTGIGNPITGPGPGYQNPPCYCVPTALKGSYTTPVQGKPNCYAIIYDFYQECLAAGPNGILLNNYPDVMRPVLKKFAGSDTLSVTSGGLCQCNQSANPCGLARISDVICNIPPTVNPNPGGPNPFNPGGGGGEPEINVNISTDFIDPNDSPDIFFPGQDSIAFSQEQEERAKTNKSFLKDKINTFLSKTFKSIKDTTLDIIEVSNAIKNNTGTVNIQDSDVILKRPSGATYYTKNTSNNRDVFSDVIHQGINDILDKNGTFKNWDASSVYSITDSIILGSLQPTVSESLKSLRTIDGSEMSDSDKADIIRGYLIDDSLEDLNLANIQKLASETSQYKDTKVIPSKIQSQNEIAALSLVENNMIPLQPKTKGRAVKIMQNWKTFASDIDKYVDIDVPGNPLNGRYYINDDDTVIEGIPSIKISDGDFLEIFSGGLRYKIPVKSEKERAFIIPEQIRYKILTLLGVNPNRTIWSETDTSSNVEFDYSLNLDNTAPRQDVYFFKLIPEETTKELGNSKSNMVVNTTGKYELVDHTSEEGLSEINEYIKYKYNHRTVFINQEDILFDYIEDSRTLYMSQLDFYVEQAKQNKQYPLIVRDYPWYLIVIPTNRQDYLLRNTKSTLAFYDVNGKNRRSLSIEPSINPNFNTQRTSIFTKTNMEINQLNVSGEPDDQSRTTVFDPDIEIYQTIYRDRSNTFGKPSTLKLTRRKTPFRLVKEIIDELDQNYVLGEKSTSKVITYFDLFSRFNQSEFNQFINSENIDYLLGKISNGLFNGVRINNPANNLLDDVSTKTKFIKRRGSASTIDKFPVIKSTNSGRYLQPPEDDFYSARYTSRVTSDIINQASNSRLT